MSKSKKESEWLEICGLWKAKPGSKLIASGQLNFGVDIGIFVNANKRLPKHPDFKLCFIKKKENKKFEKPPEIDSASIIPDALF